MMLLDMFCGDSIVSLPHVYVYLGRRELIAQRHDVYK